MAPTKKTFNEREMKQAMEDALAIQKKAHDKLIQDHINYNDKVFQEMADLKKIIMDRNSLVKDMARFIAKER